MIASTAFSVAFLLVIVAKASSVDLASRKALIKPLYDAPHVENQNSVPVSNMISPFSEDDK